MGSMGSIRLYRVCCVYAGDFKGLYTHWDLFHDSSIFLRLHRDLLVLANP